MPRLPDAEFPAWIYPVPEHRRLYERMPEPAVTGGLEPSEEGHHVPRDDPDGTVVADDHVLDASTLRCRDRRSCLAPIVAAAASDIASEPPKSNQNPRYLRYSNAVSSLLWIISDLQAEEAQGR